MGKMKYKYVFSIFLIVFTISSCDKEVTTSPPEPPPPQGFLYVDSNPQNYKIYLDGRFSGRFTPDTLLHIEETEHLIELKRKYWLDTSTLAMAEQNIVNSIYVDFMQNQKIYGNLNLYSRPANAIVEINDSLTTISTPYLLRGLLPGIYKITYHMEQHRSISTKIAVESNLTKSISLALQDTSVWVDFTEKNSNLPTSNITTLAVDKNNNLWVGTADEGLVRIKGNKWEWINKSNSALPTDSIRIIKVDNNNSIWIGTFKGLVEYRNNSVQRIIDKSNSPMYVDRVNAIDFTNDGRICVACNVGLLEIDGNSMSLYPKKGEKTERIVTSLAIDPTSNKTWVGISGNIGLLSRSFNSIVYFTKNSYFFNYINDFYVSELMIRPTDNELWAFFNSRTGIPPVIAVWNGDQWKTKRMGSENLIFTNAITDHNNIIWIASNMGLGKFNTLRDGFFLTSETTNLFNNKLTSVVEDQDGTLWIGSEYGLYKYKKQLQLQ